MIVSTILAMGLANSPLKETFHHILQNHLALGFPDGPMIELSLEEWINDGLMVVFFFVAGLEIKKEIVVGELSTPGKAALPFFAALGGMLVPAAFFFAFNWNEPHINGWGIPLATDIAYSLGILGLLANRLPAEARIFLIALAIFDDLGAILIIAVFYSSDISWLWLAGGGICVVGLIALNAYRVKMLRFYLFVGIALWLCFLYSGVHPTIAGVLLALTIPVKPTLSSDFFIRRSKERIEALSDMVTDETIPVDEEEQLLEIDRLRLESKRSNPPLIRAENALREFNSFVVLQLFVLANAGVVLNENFYEAYGQPLGLGILTGLLLGKLIGVVSFSWLSIKAGFARIQEDLKFKIIPGLGLLAGMGFTMSLFITHLGLEDESAINTSKIAIITASLLSGLAGFLYLRLVTPGQNEPE
jgi:NhaA family Na+:H+ antiporter